MDFTFSDEQKMAADTLRDLLRETCEPSALRKLMQSGAARDEARWRRIAELGFQGLLVPENAGGLGLEAQDFVLAAEACGYFALPEPFVENTGVALPLLAEFASDAKAVAGLKKALAGDITVAVGHPVNPFVADAGTAGALLMARDGALFLIDAKTAKLTVQPSIDPFRRLFTVDFSAADATRLAGSAEATLALARAFDRGALFTAAQLLGIAQRCVDLAVAYARERQQFGKPIGSYQAIKHHLATAQVKIEFARPVLYAAAAEMHLESVASRARVSHAKLAASDAADVAARTAVQVHGAMGYSWEVDVHIFLKRALALDFAWGEPKLHRARVAERVFAHPLGPDLTFCKDAAHG
ncbi:acyl-CoA dehydrogenase family protein [Terrarubrum flagellatum]|uniref:acyl-CoA dehydrogenase family protein n=1 Tax=Terrirubrum flagellatum TaxID=2895980 RepID=UPI003144EACE